VAFADARRFSSTSFAVNKLTFIDVPFHHEYLHYINRGSIISKLRLAPEDCSEHCCTHSLVCLQSHLSKRRRFQQTRNSTTYLSSGDRQPLFPNPLTDGDMKSKPPPAAPLFATPGSASKPGIATISASNCSSATFPKTTVSEPSPALFQLPEAECQYEQKKQQQMVPRLASPHSLLHPCHVCHRRPTTRSVLDAYADCELCGERACYICLRECNGPECWASTPATTDKNARRVPYISGICYGLTTSSPPPADDPELVTTCSSQNRRKICSWCAVEGVTDSGREVVWCLDCVRAVIG
jgi:hypothetical protein